MTVPIPEESPDHPQAEPEYEYYKHDNAVFRRKVNWIGPWVDDVFLRRSKTWMPYEGDCLAPVFFGSRTKDPMGIDSAMTDPEPQYDYFSHDNAVFRRRRWCSKVRSVDDVYLPRSHSWVPYRGDCLAPVVFGDRCEDLEKDSGVGFDLE